MRWLRSVILALLSTVDSLGNQFTMCNSIAAQLICRDLPRFTAMTSQYAFEKPLCLKEYIDYIAILIDSPPQEMLLAVDFDKDFINAKCVAIASMLSRFSNDDNTLLG